MPRTNELTTPKPSSQPQMTPCRRRRLLAKAQAAAAAAAAAADAARAQVAAQKLKVAEAQQRMNDLKAKIAAIARQNYINGNESVELGLLLDARDPADFATQVEAIKRTARGNDVIFEQLAALQAQLADTRAVEGLRTAGRESGTRGARSSRRCRPIT